MAPAPLDPDLDVALIDTYRRWDALERRRTDGASVLEFDLAPPVASLGGPLESREQVARALSELLASVERDGGTYAPYLAARLRGSLAYLAACEGQRLPFVEYLQRTMGCAPPDWTDAALDAWRAELVEQFGRRGIPWSAQGSEALQRHWGRRDGAFIGQALPEAADRWVARVRRDLPELPRPTYRIEVVREDAYWANWIDGDAERGVRLRVNTHPRTAYDDHSLDALAAHEIAGHALHMAGLGLAVQRGEAPGCLLGTTVHALDAFHQEGLAQVVEVLFGEPTPEGQLRLDYRRYLQARLDHAQQQVEAGADQEGVGRDLIAACPLAHERALRGNLRDRVERPLHRSYLAVYGPSLTTFLSARGLPLPSRVAWLGRAYGSLQAANRLSQGLEGAPTAPRSGREES